MSDDSLTLVSKVRLIELLELERICKEYVHMDDNELVRKMIEEGAIKIELRLDSLPPKRRQAPRRTKKATPEDGPTRKMHQHSECIKNPEVGS